ncbi:phosphoserine phosphatase [Coxiella burnetii]|uniref:phosphoserine phosphatase n=1 Tax=Coxiella burnetii TaxID=777 RepID=UPI000CCC1D32|nr:phosphoserine phosphatase [Coxiella burnetii]PNT88479.1 phosphoserine phosphatase [Coxiella burnetii]
MLAMPWRITTPIDAVIFDCDGTLSQIEGIDHLAEINNVDSEVRLLTETAMNLTGITADIYRKRLDLVNPTKDQVDQLDEQYYANLTPDAAEIISILHNLNKTVYVISAGIQAAVEAFAKRLGIPTSHVFAVAVYFDGKGRYLNYEHQSPLTYQLGKRKVIEALRLNHHRFVYVGDGMNDIEAVNLAERFIGYGGAYYRSHLAEMCDYYIKSRTLAPMLPLSLTLEEFERLSQVEKTLYQKGLKQINEGNVLINRTEFE